MCVCVCVCRLARWSYGESIESVCELRLMGFHFAIARATRHTSYESFIIGPFHSYDNAVRDAITYPSTLSIGPYPWRTRNACKNGERRIDNDKMEISM